MIFSGSQSSGTIELSQPISNFNMIGFMIGVSLSNPCTISYFPVEILRILTGADSVRCSGYDTDYLQGNFTDDTHFVIQSANVVNMLRIFGI